MAQTVECTRCGRTAPALAKPPYPGAVGRQIVENACADCWAEWEKMEVMVINELRLNFMDPRSMEVLGQHIRDFFFLPQPESPGGAAESTESTESTG
jgi:Fe-S cluster biosynthesis and repair protein YggX